VAENLPYYCSASASDESQVNNWDLTLTLALTYTTTDNKETPMKIIVAAVAVFAFLLSFPAMSKAQDLKSLVGKVPKASIATKYLWHIATNCDAKGICKTRTDSQKANRLRKKALENCDFGYPVELNPTGNSMCKGVINSTPREFNPPKLRPPGTPRGSPSLNPCDTFVCANGGTCKTEEGKPRCHCAPGFSGEKCENTSCRPTSVCPDDTHVSKPEDCLGRPLPGPIIYVCADGRPTRSLDDCVVKATGLWWRILLFLFGIIIVTGTLACFGIMWNRYRDRWIDEMALTAQLRQEVEKKDNVSLELQKKLEAMPTVSATPLPVPPSESQPTPVPSPPPEPPQPTPPPPIDEPAETPSTAGTLIGFGGTGSDQQPEPSPTTGAAPPKGGTMFHAGGASELPPPKVEQPTAEPGSAEPPTVDKPTPPADKPGDDK